MSETPAAFLDCVTEWLRDHVGNPSLTAVRVSAYGTDWAGSTESGFYDEFSVDVRYLDADGKERSMGVRGEAMEDLWRHVVGGFAVPLADPPRDAESGNYPFTVEVESTT